ncbi:tautomerase family protein [Vibrio alfacsensis]|uniref:tautomerase family protein n=1 Tax=Vibrio alfacsensis TaxID=1074311 RepID=UPI004068BF2B
MPLINITLAEGKSAEYLATVGNTLHEALMETWGIPEHDRFHIFNEIKPEHFYIDREMWGVKRSNDVIIFHFTTTPRTSEMKKAFFKRLPELLEQRLNLRPEDVFITLTTNTREDWSFGNGKQQLLED